MYKHIIYIYIYIYGTPPLRSTSEHFDILSLHVHIYIIYLCAYMYKSQLFFTDLLWVVAVHTIKTSWKQKKTIFDDSFGENPWGKPKKTKNLEKTNKKQYLETLWESSIDKIKKTSRKPKNQKKQNFSENVWSEAHVWFFLVLPRFFLFFLVLTLKKLKKLKVFLVLWIK